MEMILLTKEERKVLHYVIDYTYKPKLKKRDY